VHPTYEIVTFDPPISHESASMNASTIEDAVPFAVRPTHNDEIHSRNNGVGKTAGFEV